MRKTLAISRDFQLKNGKFIIPQLKEVPSKFWGKIVEHAEVS